MTDQVLLRARGSSSRRCRQASCTPGSGACRSRPMSSPSRSRCGSRWSLATPNFLTESNISNMMRQTSISAIIAIGVICTIMIAGIDLSVGSVVAFCGVLFAQMCGHGLDLVPAALLTLVAGLGVGLTQRRRDRPSGHSRLHRHAGRTAGLSRPRAAAGRRHDGRRPAA